MEIKDVDIEKPDFTEKERNLIDNIHKKLLDPNSTFSVTEVETLVKYERYLAIRTELFKQKREERLARDSATLKLLEDTQKKAESTLESLTNAALERLRKMEVE